MLLSIYETGFISPFSGMFNKRYRNRVLKARGKTGVYLIKENDKIVYIGMSQSCVCEALYRHFYDYADKGHHSRHIYDVDDEEKEYKVHILELAPEDAPRVEAALIACLNPRDNKVKWERAMKSVIAEYEEYQDSLKPREESLEPEWKQNLNLEAPDF